MTKRVVATSLVSAFLFASFAFSQSTTTGALSGTVTDQTDSLVPKAKIAATNASTGASFEATSDERGEYRFPLLPPGVYDLKIEKAGFAPQVRKGVSVTVGQAAVVDAKLTVSSSTQLVEVAAEAPLIETERTQQSNTIEERAVKELPINRRDYLAFSLLAPGVTDSKALADSNSFRVIQTPTSGLSFYGSNGRGNNVSVDGGESNDAGGGVRPTVSQETVQEFQINRTNYSAEHGEARGGVIDIITKSGGNATHGSVFGFFRHDSLDATDPFALVLQSNNQLTRIKPDSQRQQFGATMGGPIARDKTFYFVGYEQLRRNENSAVVVLSDLNIFQPTSAQQAYLATLPAAQADPLRSALTSPQRTIDMFKLNSGVFPFTSAQYQGLIRIDHRFNDTNTLNFRTNVTKDFETNQNIGALVGVTRGYIVDLFDSTTLANWTHTFSPTLINEARAQFDYYDPFNGSNDPFGPALEIAGFGAFNRDRFLPAETIARREDLVENLTWVKGKHTLKLGANVLIREAHVDSKTFFPGRFTFGALPGSLAGMPASIPINALQAFNLGLAQSYQQGFGNPVVRAIYPYYAGYAQDTWRVKPNLTLNIGLRYEIDHRKEPLPTDHREVSPRVGFAWDPFNDKKTTVRGGYGIFYSTIDFQIDDVVNYLNEIDGYRGIAQVLTTGVNPAQLNGPVNIFRTLVSQGVIGIPTPQRTIAPSDLAQFNITISQTGPRPPLTVLFGPDPHYSNPYSQQGSFGIDRQFPGGLTASVSYVYVRGVHLTTSLDRNLLPAPISPITGAPYWGVTAGAGSDNPTGTKYFKDPLLFQGNVYESGANSWYNGLIVEMNKRFSSNATFAFNYTFSKAEDETLDFNSDFQPPDQTCRACEKALSSFDQRHKVVAYALLQSPRASGDSAWRKFVGGFGFTPIFRFNSSRPFNILAGGELNGDRHNTTDRPYYAGRNIGIGPSYWSFDTRLSRRFAVTERSNLELMFEAFNLFNHLNYAGVNNTVGCVAAISTTSGAINPTALVGNPGSCYISDIVQANKGSLSGNGANTPLQPFGFTSAFEPRKIQLGLRFSF